MNDNAVGYIFVEDDSTYNYMYDAIFLDASRKRNFCTIVEKPFDSKLNNILRKRRVQRHIGSFLSFYYTNQYLLQERLDTISQQYQEVIVLFTNSSFIRSKYPIDVLKKYKKRYKNLKYVLLYVDIVNHPVSEYANFLRSYGIFDLVYTVDKTDAVNYGFEYTFTPYSIDEKKIINAYKKGVYFCGATKGRESEIVSFYRRCSAKKIETSMDIICTDENIKSLISPRDRGARLRKKDDYLLYPEVLSRSLGYSCILEIVQKNQTALTLRAYEAVCYNRKLLTNNKTILEFPYYNKRYMQYFESMDDIDWNWIKSTDHVDYGYKGDFSPILLLDRINNELKIRQ